MFIKDKKLFTLFVITMTVLAFIHVLFYFVQFFQVNVVSKGIESVLRKELEGGDSYYISKAVKDLEHLQLFECSVLKRLQNDKLSYLNLQYDKNCDGSFFSLNGINVNRKILSLNGDEWIFSFKTINGHAFYLALWLIRILMVIFIFIVYKFYIEKLERKLQSMRMKSDLAEKINNISRQVAHDIRSPLSALDMMMKDVSDLPEDKRVIMRSAVTRIQDIANDLLNRNKQLKGSDRSEEHLPKMQTVLLTGLIETLLSEKRIQFRSRSNVSIESSLGTQAYGLFASVNIIEFKRILSNLINNAVEALDRKDGGRVLVTLASKDEGSLLLTVEDNGGGISEEILTRLGAAGETHGKENGNGLGLYHAITTIESWNGKFFIESKEGNGTKVSIILFKCKIPKTFVPQISLTPNSKAVAIDDDDSIHQIWKGRFESAKTHENNILLIHFSGPMEFNAWASENSADLYLVDYEFIGESLNGIELVKKWGIENKSILVTSRYEEEHVLSECEKANIKLLPKGLAGFVPFSVTSTLGDSRKKISNILVDDDALVRLTWECRAKEKNINLEVFSSSDELLKVLERFAMESVFYIDSNLADGQKGEELAFALFSMGYKNLYLATGYDPDQFASLDHIKGVIGKTAPW